MTPGNDGTLNIKIHNVPNDGENYNLKCILMKLKNLFSKIFQLGDIIQRIAGVEP